MSPFCHAFVPITCDVTSYFYPSLKKEIKEKEKKREIK